VIELLLLLWSNNSVREYLMNIFESFVLPLVRWMDHPGVSLSFLPYFKRYLGRNPQDLRRLMSNPAWEARWVASQKMTGLFSAEDAWIYLCRLAEDPERNVREGAARGFGLLLSQSPPLKQRYKDALTDTDTSGKLRKALLHSAVVLWREFPEQVETAVYLMTAAAEQPPQGCFQTIGSHLLAVELMKSHPQTARQLKRAWAASSNTNLNYHASRSDGQKPDMAGHPLIPDAWSNTSEIRVPRDTLAQVIGQDHAVKIVLMAAQQRRFIFLMGDPGTGKSMLAQAMAEQTAGGEPEDVIALPNPKYTMNPLIQTVPVHTGMGRIEQIKKARHHARQSVQFLWWTLFLGVCVSGTVLTFIYKGWVFPLVTVLMSSALFWVKKRMVPAGLEALPKLLVSHPTRPRTPFIDATGLQAGALFGDVRHDPFQSGGRETPPHQLLEPGAVHLAHKGILFIDEVGTLSMESQQQLLTVIQEKRSPIVGRLMNSSGSMVRSQPIPCDFTLVLAGNLEDMKKMHPALRSRVQGFGYEVVTAHMVRDLPENRKKFVQFVAQEVFKDGRIPHFTKEAVERVIGYAGETAGRDGYLSLRLRELGGVVRASGDMAVSDGKPLVEAAHVAKALQIKKSAEEQIKAFSYGQ
jgi:hypothetical protein